MRKLLIVIIVSGIVGSLRTARHVGSDSNMPSTMLLHFNLIILIYSLVSPASLACLNTLITLRSHREVNVPLYIRILDMSSDGAIVVESSIDSFENANSI